MATSRAFAYNTGSGITGTDQVGNLAISVDQLDYSASPGGVTWWEGPDEEPGYIITRPVAGMNQPTPVSGVTAGVAFRRSTSLTDSSFIELANNFTGNVHNFTNAATASAWLTANGYWNSYSPPVLPAVLSLDAGNPTSYPGTGTTWTDLIGGKVFNLINGPGYDPGNGGKIYFHAPSGQYADCSASLPSLSTFTVSVWIYWDGVNSGGLPCIITEIYTGGALNYMLGAPQGVTAQGGYFNGGFQVSPQFTLTANAWSQIVLTCDAGQIVKIHVNNTLISTTPTSGVQPSSSNSGIRLMRRWDNAEFFGGYLATLDIYNTALTDSQVNTIFNSTKSRFGL
jgi:hypothetical protein